MDRRRRAGAALRWRRVPPTPASPHTAALVDAAAPSLAAAPPPPPTHKLRHRRGPTVGPDGEPAGCPPRCPVVAPSRPNLGQGRVGRRPPPTATAAAAGRRDGGDANDAWRAAVPAGTSDRTPGPPVPARGCSSAPDRAAPLRRAHPRRTDGEGRHGTGGHVEEAATRGALPRGRGRVSANDSHDWVTPAAPAAASHRDTERVVRVCAPAAGTRGGEGAPRPYGVDKSRHHRSASASTPQGASPARQRPAPRAARRTPVRSHPRAGGRSPRARG